MEVGGFDGLTCRTMSSGSSPRNRCSTASKPAMVSPEPMPVTPSSVCTRTIVASKCRRGSGSQAAASGGSSSSRSRSRVMAVIFIGWPPARARSGPGAPGPVRRTGWTPSRCARRPARRRSSGVPSTAARIAPEAAARRWFAKASSRSFTSGSTQIAAMISSVRTSPRGSRPGLDGVGHAPARARPARRPRWPAGAGRSPAAAALGTKSVGGCTGTDGRSTVTNGTWPALGVASAVAHAVPPGCPGAPARCSCGRRWRPRRRTASPMSAVDAKVMGAPGRWGVRRNRR